MRNHTKPRGGTNGGLGRGLEEPNLSGAYIRSLVKQLASSRKHAYPGGLNPTSKTPVGEASKRQTCAQAPMQIDREGSDNIMKLPSNLEEHASAAINPVVLQQKKQVRRRPHTRRQSQECLIDIAEARREIVAALHLHRAANGSATKPPPNPSIKPARINIRNSLSSKHSTSAKQSAGNNSTRCNSCMSKAVSSTATTQRACNEARAITICGHLLCWMCLSQSLQHFSASPIFKRCPVCFKPLNMGNDIFPITLGVPILQASHESAYASPVLQSAPLLIDQLPAAQPAWSTTGPSLLPMSTGMNIAQNPSFYQHENMTDLASCSGPPERANLGLTNIEQDCPKNWHVAMDDEELSQIRSLGEQHDMEWNDTVNIATSTRWFKFLKSSEIPDCLYEREMEKNDNTGLHKLWEAPDDVGFDVQLLTEEPLISNFIDRNTIKECLHILPELPIESLWLDDCFDYHDCMQGLMNQENYNENNPLACSEILKSTSADDTAI